MAALCATYPCAVHKGLCALPQGTCPSVPAPPREPTPVRYPVASFTRCPEHSCCRSHAPTRAVLPLRHPDRPVSPCVSPRDPRTRLPSQVANLQLPNPCPANSPVLAGLELLLQQLLGLLQRTHGTGADTVRGQVGACVSAHMRTSLRALHPHLRQSARRPAAPCPPPSFLLRGSCTLKHAHNPECHRHMGSWHPTTAPLTCDHATSGLRTKRETACPINPHLLRSAPTPQEPP